MSVEDPARTYAELHETYERFTRDEDVSLLLAPETTRRLQELMEWLGRSKGTDDRPLMIRVARLMAWVHLTRWRDDPKRAGASGELDRALAMTFALPYGQGAPEPLRSLVERGHQALQAESTDPMLLQDFAGALVTMADRYGSAGALEHGLRYQTRILDRLSEDDPQWPAVVMNHCAAVLVEWRLTGASAHLDLALARGRRALGRLEDAPNIELAQFCFQFSRLVLARHAGSPSLRDVDEAIELAARAVGLEGVSEALGRQFLVGLGGAWYVRHLTSGRGDDLDRAIDTLSGVVPDQDPLGGTFHEPAGVLASCWLSRARLADGEDDLRRALRLRLLLATERGTSDDLVDLAGVQEQLYQRSGQAGLLDEAVGNYAKATANDAEDVTALIGLAWALNVRFESFGDQADRDDAITAARRSVDLTPLDHGSLGRRLAILAAALTSRTRTTGSTPDLVEGLSVIDRALALPDESDEDRAQQLFNKSALIAVSYGMSGDPAANDLHVDLCREAVALLPGGHPKKAMYHTNLVAAYLERYRRTEDLRDLDDALRAGDVGLAEIPLDHPRRAPILSNQALALFQSVGEGFDEGRLRSAVQLFTEALALTPSGQPVDALILVNRGSALFRCGEPADVELALRDWRTAASNESASPGVRLAAATGWARRSAELGRWDEAVGAYTLAVELVTSVAGLQLEREDKETQLTGWVPVPAEATAAALEVDDPEKALELLEAGRCVQWNHQLRNAAELALLTDVRPDLAAEIERSSTALGVVWSSAPELASLEGVLAETGT
ncbi:hypothetical protein [Streptomyces pseudovenezuelae]|uniref:Tetratricopeptide repeat protein n=1 Tax=Streptomyces pseudovenezuelae TaxID=67350 RepID=A0ABT6LGC6_9ACTN|nr:hypothetical protein [Streptomyces pseudovenezuelae]MDH6215348.1 hypothetical protein [Streptomyces pseudovenezuelae]